MENTSYYKSPLATFLIKDNGSKITLLKKAEDDFQESFTSEISLKLKTQLDEYFTGKRQIFDITYEAKGTEFQQKVWQALKEIPYGTTCSYKDIAIQIGKPQASRAVGSACNKNPLLLLIPCHRVLSSSAKLTGYSGGLALKESLLKLEKTQE